MYLMTDGGFLYRMNAVVSELYEELLQRFLNGNALIFLKKKSTRRDSSLTFINITTRDLSRFNTTLEVSTASSR